MVWVLLIIRVNQQLHWTLSNNTNVIITTKLNRYIKYEPVIFVMVRNLLRWKTTRSDL
jgi:hypothetical protein